MTLISFFQYILRELQLLVILTCIKTLSLFTVQLVQLTYTNHPIKREEYKENQAKKHLKY